jgi:hypothetical protein
MFYNICMSSLIKVAKAAKSWWPFLCPNFLRSTANIYLRRCINYFIMVCSIALIRLDNKVLGATPYLSQSIQSTRIFSFKVDINQMKTTQTMLPRVVNAKTQEVIDEFFSSFEANDISNKLLDDMLIYVVETKGISRQLISDNVFLCSQIIKLITAIDVSLNGWNDRPRPCMN